jgi:hypothetical protein
MPRLRHLGLLAGVFLLMAAAIGLGPAQAQSPVRDVAGARLAAPAAVDVAGVDLHDGQLQKFGSTYYLYGTMYGCGFSWQQANTPWCGFGVSTAPSMTGPWSTPTLLFSASAPDPYNPGKTYQATCGASGQGCFSPRMVQRSGWGANDGVFVLWFNAPWYYSSGAPHAYMIMGCNGPTGPCGASAGAPYGTTHRPTLHQCNGANGDPGISASSDGTSIYLLCPMVGTTSVAVEQLSKWGSDGTGVGATNVAGLTAVEAMGMWRDPSTSTWVMTYSDIRCGYCAGTGTGYATAPSPLGPWTAPGNLGVGAPVNARRLISANSCGGQPDTVSVIDGQPWQKINLWTGQMNETAAGLHFEPLTYTPTSGSAGDGQLWHPPFADWTCA